MMKRAMWYLLPFLLAVAGCAGKLEGDVVTFHQGPLPRGETIQVVSGDPDNQGSLEFEHYAGLIREKLSRIGYRPAKVIPYMITALFTNFPGESGVTKIVSIEKNH